MSDLTIVVAVRGEQTMSQYAMAKSGKLTFQNASGTDTLVVTSKASNPGVPFCENDKTTEIPRITVAPGGSETVRICTAYGPQDFLYEAQIGMAAVEDPIVVLDKSKKMFNYDPLSLTAGIVAGAALAVIGMRLWQRKAPQRV